MIVAIEALIGTGKTTLTNSLCDKHGYTRFLEPVESNPLSWKVLFWPTQVELYNADAFIVGTIQNVSRSIL